MAIEAGYTQIGGAYYKLHDRNASDYAEAEQQCEAASNETKVFEGETEAEWNALRQLIEGEVMSMTGKVINKYRSTGIKQFSPYYLYNSTSQNDYGSFQ